jgi:MYXO-CTERM domain-containing protein
MSVSAPIDIPTVVPLPPAYLSAGAVLIGLGAAGFVRRRWNRWVRSSLA